ncbi:hypothetical protein ZIOFF_040226 [Zingiber officinale]|uniref:Core-2/I-branching beta-1,6-N-acetylglucosaminyltransferase family protein n=1 Tax=Zingiber officinale TaxID=94328 RepID=A0A8J5L476_ZINOF|nr:hypothetical protein ZIOFF_040226 [Zingiber officinale]
MEAERRLLANALLDFSNQRFVLLSETCVPLFDFATVYSYLINSSRIFIESYDDAGPSGRGRYRRPMKPRIKLQQWRKGSQWFAMDRSLAVDLISDEDYFPLFQRYCRPLCFADEHYVQTLVSVRNYWSRNANRSLTWVDWSRRGMHPAKFGRSQINVELLQRMRNGSSCSYNGESTRVCFLFARKFLPNTVSRLLPILPPSSATIASPSQHDAGVATPQATVIAGVDVAPSPCEAARRACMPQTTQEPTLLLSLISCFDLCQPLLTTEGCIGLQIFDYGDPCGVEDCYTSSQQDRAINSSRGQQLLSFTAASRSFTELLQI